MIKIFTIGKTKESYFKRAIEEYLKRIKRFTKIEYEEVTRESILKSLTQNNFIITLEIKGKQLSSEEFAELLKKKEIEKPIAFYIGSEEGLPKEITAKANLGLSFSGMTFPHELARVMLFEQVYRALSINKNLPYHK